MKLSPSARLSALRSSARSPRAGLFRTAAVFTAAVHLATTQAVAAIRLVWQADPADSTLTAVEATGLPSESLRILAQTDRSTAQWQALLSVTTETDDLFADLNLPPLAGTYRIAGRTLRFTPAFPPAEGVTYRATFRPAALPGAIEGRSALVSATHRLSPRVVKPTTVVSAVYPSTAVLPENLLKFYLHFSAPMTRGHIYDHIHLLDASGQPVELPFLEIDEELWNPDLTRLTLFLDPGRIKRGVKPLEDVGPSLEAGRSYTLVIDPSWHDATGAPLRNGFTKKFTVGAADREPPDPARWQLEAPEARSRAAVRLAFSEPLDRALLERLFRVTDAAGQAIAGTVSVGTEERAWSFVPDQPWPAGGYRVQFPSNIEDLAGNNVGKPFDVDLFERVERWVTNAVVTLPFTVN